MFFDDLRVPLQVFWISSWVISVTVWLVIALLFTLWWYHDLLIYPSGDGKSTLLGNPKKYQKPEAFGITTPYEDVSIITSDGVR
jgi:hypothetical protein